MFLILRFLSVIFDRVEFYLFFQPQYKDLHISKTILFKHTRLMTYMNLTFDQKTPQNMIFQHSENFVLLLKRKTDFLNLSI